MALLCYQYFQAVEFGGKKILDGGNIFPGSINFYDYFKFFLLAWQEHSRTPKRTKVTTTAVQGVVLSGHLDPFNQLRSQGRFTSLDIF